jgi:hypothetical protein
VSEALIAVRGSRLVNVPHDFEVRAGLKRAASREERTAF